MSLSKKTCVPCTSGANKLTAAECEDLLKQVSGWNIEDGNKKISKGYKFSDFMQAMSLANEIAQLAEEENHHPDLLVRWGELKIEIWTHKVDGLTENDFILASKIDRLDKKTRN